MANKKKEMIKITEIDPDFEVIRIWYLANFAHLEEIFYKYRRKKVKVTEKNYKKAVKDYFPASMSKTIKKIELIAPTATGKKQAKLEKPEIIRI